MLKKVAEIKITENPYDVKFILRQIAKEKFPELYHKRVKTPGIPNTVGKILFGVPDFAGVYRQRVYEDKVEIFLEIYRLKMIVDAKTILDIEDLLLKTVREVNNR